MVQAGKDRLAGLGGIAFAVLFALGMMVPPSPGGGESQETITNMFADSGDRMLIIIGAFLLAFAGLALVSFLLGLYYRLRQAEGEPGRLSVTVLVTGILFVSMLFVTSSTIGAVASGIEFGEEPQPGNEIPTFLLYVGFLALTVNGMLAMIVTIVLTSVLARRTGVLPQWLVWTGFVCAVVLVFSVVFLPMLALSVWTAAAGVAMLTSPAAQPERATRPASATI